MDLPLNASKERSRLKEAALFFGAWLLPALLPAVNVTVNATSALRTMPDELFGQNMAAWEGTADGTDAGYNQAVTAMGSPLIRFPGGSYGDILDWSNMACGSLFWLPIDLQDGINFANATGGKLQAIVNYSGYWCDTNNGHAAAVAKAADWVRYMNVTGGGALRTTYWEVGNETFGNWEQGYVGEDVAAGGVYGNNFVDFFNAMKAVDPSIKVGAQCQFDVAPFSQGVLQTLRTRNVVPDFLIAHAYPLWVPGRYAADAPAWDANLYASNPYTDGRILDNADQATTITNQMNALVSTHLGASYVGQVPYWMTEYRSTTSPKNDEFVDAMFCAQFLLGLGQQGWGGANNWDLKNGYNTVSGSDGGLLRGGGYPGYPDASPLNGPRPTYYIYPYLSRVFGRNLVQCTVPAYVPMVSGSTINTTGNKVRAWASRDASGNLTIFLANNNWAAADTANITINNFAAGAAGQMWTFQGAGNTYYGPATPIAQRLHIAINGVQDPAVSSLPGTGNAITTGTNFSVNLPALSMVLIRVPVGGASPTPTRTATRTATRTSTGTLTRSPTLTWTRTATPTNTVPANTRTSTATLTRSQTPTWTRTGTASQTRTHTPTGTLTRSPTTTWTRTGTVSQTLTHTPTGTRTGTPSQTLSQSPTVTPSATASRTSTHSPTASRTPSHTPSRTASATGTLTHTPVPTLSTSTATPTFTGTATASLTRSPTGTSTSTSTSTPSSSPTPSVSGTVTPTPSPTATSTPTATLSFSSSPTLTRSSSPTATPTATVTSLDTYTNSPTLSPTPSQTLSPSSSATRTGTATPIPTATLTGTGAMTVTLSATPPATGSPTVTLTTTPSATPSATLTASPLATGTRSTTVTVTPMATSEAGLLEVLQAVAWPNPNPRAVSVQLSRSADKVTVKLWTRDLKGVCQAEAAPAPGGWSQVALPTACLGRLANGTYFYTVTAELDGAVTKGTKPGKLVILR